MDVMQPFTNRPIRESRSMSLYRPPMLGIGPFLVDVKLVKIRHKIFGNSPSRVADRIRHYRDFGGP